MPTENIAKNVADQTAGIPADSNLNPAAPAAVTPASDKIKILFNGKEVEVTPIQPGVVQRTKSIFYVQDSVTKEWLYCFPERLEKLMKKYNGDLSQYKGRDSRAAERTQTAAAKKLELDAKKVEAEKAKVAAAEKVKADAEKARLTATAPVGGTPNPNPAPAADAPAAGATGPTEAELKEIAAKEEADASKNKKAAAKSKK